jgi:beta-lactamase class D
MTGLVYKELPIEDLTHLTRTEFVNGTEQKFYDALLQSMTKHGMRDPVFINQRKDKNNNLILKVTVGNNRMVIAKKLGLKLIRSIIKLLDPKNNNIKGRPLNTEQEIIDLFFSKEDLQIKKEDGVIYEVMPKNPQKYGKI